MTDNVVRISDVHSKGSLQMDLIESEHSSPVRSASSKLAAASTVETQPSHPFCALCDGTELKRLGHEASALVQLPAPFLVPLHAGACLFERGTQGDAIYVLQSGIVKETMPTRDGGECIVRLAVRNSIAGLCALLGQPHAHSAYVMHPGTACRIPIACIDRLKAERATLLEELQKDWQRSVDEADQVICSFGHGSARARLARALLYLSSVLAPAEPLRLRQRDLSDLLAITPVSVARLMGLFRREGLIELRQRHCIGVDSVRLSKIAYGDASAGVPASDAISYEA